MKKILLPLFGLLLAAPVLVNLTACDTSSKPGGSGSSVLGGGKIGAAGAAGNNTAGNGGGGAGGTAGTPGNPSAAAALVGIWGIRDGQQGLVWEFTAAGEYEFTYYVLQGTQAAAEFNNGTYTANGNQIQLNIKNSTSCPPSLGQGMVAYQLSGGNLQITLPSLGNTTFTKNNAPDPNTLDVTFGCFDDNNNFTPSATQP